MIGGQKIFWRGKEAAEKNKQTGINILN